MLPVCLLLQKISVSPINEVVSLCVLAWQSVQLFLLLPIMELEVIWACVSSGTSSKPF